MFEGSGTDPVNWLIQVKDCLAVVRNRELRFNYKGINKVWVYVCNWVIDYTGS